MRPPISLGTILLVAANLIPLAGVLWWNWDVFLLLILYWCETVVIAFWTIVRVLLGPTRLGKKEEVEVGAVGRIAFAAFISVHAGIFISVHFVFLWVLFSGTWAEVVHTPAEFIDRIILGTDLWIPLVILFLVRGSLIMWPRIRRRLGLVPEAEPEYEGNPLAGLYARIFVMQVTIIVGGWLVMMANGPVWALALLVLLKTLVEVFWDPVLGWTTKRAPAAPEGRHPAGN